MGEELEGRMGGWKWGLEFRGKKFPEEKSLLNEKAETGDGDGIREAGCGSGGHIN